jgi:hypothetical protein
MKLQKLTDQFHEELAALIAKYQKLGIYTQKELALVKDGATDDDILAIRQKARTIMTLEKTGDVIALLRGCYICVHYQLGPSDVWAKYSGLPRTEYDHAEAMGHFTTKDEVILDANRVAKYYNCTLEVAL